MTTISKWCLAAALGLAPITAMAQSSDAAYCNALVTKYQQYLDMNSRHGQQPVGAATRVSAEQCKAGNPAGIPDLEKALKAAGYDLPPRT